MKYDSDMLYIAQMEKGEKLYHYTTIDALINIISGKELWITKWDYLNDIDEFRTAIEACEEVLREERIKPEIIEELKKSVKKYFSTDNLWDDCYILSCSYDSDSQLLWSYYSNYDGINIEIDFETFTDELNHNILWHGSVSYGLEMQKKSLRNTFYNELIGVDEFGHIDNLYQINDLKGREYKMTISHMSVICILYSMFFKKECFEGEREYRFVFSNVREREICFRNKNSIVTPFMKKELANLNSIKGITIGPTNKIDIASKGIKQLLHYYDINVDVVKSQIPLRY